MRRLFAGIVCTTWSVAVLSTASFAADLTYETNLLANTSDSTFRMDHLLSLSLSRVLTPSVDGRTDVPQVDELFVRHSLMEHGQSSWGAALSVTRGLLSARVFLHERHDRSIDPFRLVHGSVRTDGSRGVAMWWHGPFPGHAQYVGQIPLRGDHGPLLFGQISASPHHPVRLTALSYGTEWLRHRFIVVDGELVGGNYRLQWGTARQDGVEIGQFAGGFFREPVQERARFVRLQSSFGHHRAWLLLHDTSDHFRSLAAATYPFRRGTAAIESRWQWRPGTNRLVSVYGEWRMSRDGQSFQGVEAGYSSMPRRQWGWRVGWDSSWEDGVTGTTGWSVTLTNPDRRFQHSLTVSRSTGRPTRRRIRLQWDDGRWRARLSADDQLPAWRVEWRWTSGHRWLVTVVFKQRLYADRGVVSWVHAALTHHIPGFGQVWLQWMEPDLGRLDVGWTRAKTIGAGLRVSF